MTPITRYHGDKVFVDYLYVNHTRLDICVTTRVLGFEPKTVADVPNSHTSIWELKDGDAPSYSSIPECLNEKLLKPVALFKDPFRNGRHKMVLCDVLENRNTPIASSHRQDLVEIAKKTTDKGILVGFEQEYYITGEGISTEITTDKVMADYHNMVGLVKSSSFQRQMAEDHVNACLTAGLDMYGYNREKARGQWEYQLGPSDPVTLADHTIISRYILGRIAEMNNVDVTFDPLPKGHTHPSGLHINFSTLEMRKDGGIRAIEDTLTSMSNIPQDQLLQYYDRNGGRDNAVRLAGGKHVPTTEFTVGWGTRNSAIRVPKNVVISCRGYFEERRPSSDCDPYELLSVFIKAAVLNRLP